MKHCGFSQNKEKYKLVNVLLSTNFTGSVPLKVRVNNYEIESNSSDIIDNIEEIVLETKYGSTFIKVIDAPSNNLNPDVVYTTNYLLQLKAIKSDPNVKSYNHDILFNVYNYLHFLDKHNIDFNYSNLIVLANVPNLDNAFFNGSYLVFGNGCNGHTPLVSQMIVAHELTHALISKTCNLEYEGHSGALNEHLADVFGVCFEFYVQERFMTLGYELGSETGFLLRDMKDPHRCWQPEKMFDDYYQDPNDYHDNGGVHINSGIPNHIFYLVQEKIGHKKAFEFWIRIMFRLQRCSNFNDFKNTVLSTNKILNFICNDTLKEILDSHIYNCK
jgi:Zn-dependent metalloprotease